MCDVIIPGAPPKTSLGLGSLGLSLRSIQFNQFRLVSPLFIRPVIPNPNIPPKPCWLLKRSFEIGIVKV